MVTKNAFINAKNKDLKSFPLNYPKLSATFSFLFFCRIEE